jgi:hypothetical protein
VVGEVVVVESLSPSVSDDQAAEAEGAALAADGLLTPTLPDDDRNPAFGGTGEVAKAGGGGRGD